MRLHLYVWALVLVLGSLVAVPQLRAKDGAAEPRLALETHPDGWWFAGEQTRRTWPLTVSAAAAAAGGDFRIGYLAPVSALPSGSIITLRINGRVVGRAPIEAPTAIKVARFVIAPGAFAAGVNAVSVEIRQRHRVDCGRAAVDELYLRIDPVRTGFVPAARAEHLGGLAELAAVARDATGALPIRVRVKAGLDAAATGDLLLAVQAAALATRATNPVVTFSEATEAPGAGLDLVMGGPVPGARLTADAASGRRTLTFGGASADIRRASAELAEQAHTVLPGTAPGRAALAAMTGTALSAAGGPIDLGQLGVGDDEASALARRFAFGLTLPADSVPGDYAKVAVDLVLSGVEGGARAARVDILVAGVSVSNAIVPLKPGAETRARLLFPAGKLQAGPNRLAVQVSPPRAATELCPATEAAFLVAPTAVLTMPPLARLPAQGNLADPFGAGGLVTQPLVLHVPAPDRAAMGAAATLLARMAVRHGTPAQIQFSRTAPDHAAPVLAVGAAHTFDRALVAASGLDPEQLRTAWASRPASAVHVHTGPFNPVGRRRVLREDRPDACRASAHPQAGNPLAAAHLVLAKGARGITLVAAADTQSLEAAVACLGAGMAHGEAAALDASNGRLTVLVPSRPQFAFAFEHGAANARLAAAAFLTARPDVFACLSLGLVAIMAAAAMGLLPHVGREE